MKAPLDGSAQTLHRVERRPAQRLVNTYNFSAYKIHFLNVKQFNSDGLEAD